MPDTLAAAVGWEAPGRNSIRGAIPPPDGTVRKVNDRIKHTNFRVNIFREQRQQGAASSQGAETEPRQILFDQRRFVSAACPSGFCDAKIFYFFFCPRHSRTKRKKREKAAPNVKRNRSETGKTINTVHLFFKPV